MHKPLALLVLLLAAGETHTGGPTGGASMGGSGAIIASGTNVSDGKVLVMGGSSTSSYNTVPIESAELYDPASKTFASTQHSNDNRSGESHGN